MTSVAPAHTHAHVCDGHTHILRLGALGQQLDELAQLVDDLLTLLGQRDLGVMRGVLHRVCLFVCDAASESVRDGEANERMNE